jgi:hypothetical protein
MQESAVHGRGPFDSFLDEEFVITPLNAQKLWKASSSNYAGDKNLFAQQSSLPYDPKDMESIANWVVDKLQPILTWLWLPQKCAHCKEEYRPLHNLGRWMCRWHPGERLEHSFSCCGRSTRGCQPCDHSPISKIGQVRWTEDNTGVRVPQILYRMIGFKDESIVELLQDDDDVARSYYWVNRAPKYRL